MNKFFTRSLLLVVIVSLFSCAAEDRDDVQSAAFNGTDLSTTLAPSDLVGTWNLSVMQADTPVDLNSDGTSNNNILNETNCFDQMGVVFREDMTFTATNAKLGFSGGIDNDEITCESGRADSGTWDVDGDVLILDINVGGIIYTERKQLTITPTTFAFAVTKFESDKYVSDPGDSSASPIRILSLEYAKN
ncbi:lipocalin family protein [Gillisia sp. Hel_I_29]|uniref:lipocalin family protein n=1 Tax=Gillisia sp. Hel_I_29 TaxID=1249975 RepID=UPI000552CF29|nr:lipocalin family protein [Gillisia sp. Hel_I_29]